MKDKRKKKFIKLTTTRVGKNQKRFVENLIKSKYKKKKRKKEIRRRENR